MSLQPVTNKNQRRSSYKAAIDTAIGRRKRHDNLLEIRKCHRQQNLLKRRNDLHLQTQLQFDNIPSLVAGLYAKEINTMVESTTQICKLLSQKCPPTDEVVQAGAVSHLIEILKRQDFPQLQFEAAWALTNITSGTSENTKAVVDHGAVLVFLELLVSSRDNVREQMVWALGNIAGDSPKYRDFVLENGALLPLLSQFETNASVSMLRTATFTLANLCRGKPQPPFQQLKPALPVLRTLLLSNDEQVLVNACWALGYLSNGINDEIQHVIEAEVYPLLLNLLHHPSPRVLTPVLGTVGNIVAEDDMHIQHIINPGPLTRLFDLLTGNFERSIKKETCWIISNITAVGNKEQIQAVMNAGLIAPLVNLLQNVEFDVRTEAAWAISNVTCEGSHEQIKFLVDHGCIKPLCDMLDSPDSSTVIACLDGLHNILNVGEAEQHDGGTNLYKRVVEDVEGFDKISGLQTHDNYDIYLKAVEILETYWSNEEDENEEDPSSGFNFMNMRY